MKTSVPPLVNKVTKKAIITIDLADWLPAASDIEVIDLKQYLYKELLLREADFRAAVEGTDWSPYRDKLVTLHCSCDAIVPVWAYMVITAFLAGIARDVVCCAPSHAREVFFYRALANVDMNPFKNQRVVIKGCGEAKIDASAYVYFTQKIASVARTINYGDACSMLPIFKRSTD